MTDEQQAHPQFSEVKGRPSAELGKLYMRPGKRQGQGKMQISGAPLAAAVSV